MTTKSMGFIGKCNSFFHHYPFYISSDKKGESDSQMIMRVGRKFAILLFFIFMFDTLLDWFLDIMDSVFDLVHLGIEIIEHTLIVFLENTLHTNHQESETIIVNGTLILIFYAAYLVYRAAPKLYFRFSHYVSAVWLQTIERESSCWHALTLVRKIKVICVYSFCIAFVLSLLSL